MKVGSGVGAGHAASTQERELRSRDAAEFQQWLGSTCHRAGTTSEQPFVVAISLLHFESVRIGWWVGVSLGVNGGESAVRRIEGLAAGVHVQVRSIHASLRPGPMRGTRRERLAASRARPSPPTSEHPLDSDLLELPDPLG